MFEDTLPSGAYDLPDKRDFDATHILGAEEVTIPDVIKLPLEEGNQGSSVECTLYSSYHAAQIANEIEHKIKLNPSFDLGWEFQGKFGTRTSKGDSVQTALKSLVKNGLQTNGKIYKIEGYAKIEKDMIDYWLAQGYAIVTSAKTTKTNFKKAKHEGIWGGMDGDVVTGHAFIISGKEPGFKIASNSYGSDWGKFKDGTFKIADKDVVHLGTCYVVYDTKDLEYIYKDVTTESPFAEAIVWAKEKGYLKGYEDGRFGPGDSLTRGQFTEVLYRMFKDK